MRYAIALAALLLAPGPALADNETVIEIDPDGGTWRLHCDWQGAPAVTRTGSGPETLRFPPGRLACEVTLIEPGAVRIEAVSARGSRSNIRISGTGGVSRFTLD